MSRFAGKINHRSHFLKARGLQAWLLTAALSEMLGEGGRGELDDEKGVSQVNLAGSASRGPAELFAQFSWGATAENKP